MGILSVILSVSQRRGEANSIYSSNSLSNAIFHNSFINSAGQILNWHKRAEKEKSCQLTLVKRASEIIMRVRQHFRNTQQRFADPPWHASVSTGITVDGISSRIVPPGKANSPRALPLLPSPAHCEWQGRQSEKYWTWRIHVTTGRLKS